MSFSIHIQKEMIRRILFTNQIFADKNNIKDAVYKIISLTINYVFKFKRLMAMNRTKVFHLIILQMLEFKN